MRAGRFIFIDRQNATSARRTIDAAADRIRKGCSVVIFPEGTRSRDGQLGPFKKGGFHLAINSGADVVPVAIRGSREIMPRGALLMRAGVVDIDIGEPISTAGLGADDRQQLLDQVRARVTEMLAEPAAPSKSPGGA
jgi:1-acyl-sn-glycerol-3-phosphate acyltransferase